MMNSYLRLLQAFTTPIVSTWAAGPHLVVPAFLWKNFEPIRPLKLSEHGSSSSIIVLVMALTPNTSRPWHRGSAYDLLFSGAQPGIELAANAFQLDHTRQWGGPSCLSGLFVLAFKSSSKASASARSLVRPEARLFRMRSLTDRMRSLRPSITTGVE
jgi:hypothetical protein